jgi:hypothetical protein
LQSRALLFEDRVSLARSSAEGAGGWAMRISIANISKKVKTAEFSATVHAVARQVNQDFAPLWGMDADVRGIAIDRNAKPSPELTLSDVILYVGEIDDDPQKVADAVGYHDLNNKGIPYGFVFTDVAAKIGEAWSTTLSHEVLELLADPDVNLLVVGPHPKNPKGVALRTYEVCDPVQSDSYDIDGIKVSNFVTPLYFAQLPRPNATRTNYLNNGLDRFGVRPGGYFSYFDLSTRRWNDVFGEGAEARAKTKEILGMARRVRRHVGQRLASDL